jgi:tRNA modification GTPase
MNAAETIFALSSGRLPSGLAVIRVSGARVRFVLETIFGQVPAPRSMAFGRFKDKDFGVIDRGLVVYFPSPASFTGEDCAEFHIHGSTAVVRLLSNMLSALDGVRHAEPGEFTKRAFLNGKLDLTQAEGLGDLIASETEAQRRLALMQSEGRLRTLYDGWRSRLVRCRALVEAVIDFSDEDDVSDQAIAGVSDELLVLGSEVQDYLVGSQQAELIRDGYNVVILGAPNSGKSSLINAFAGREVAIAADEPGTTRDLIDVRLELNGNLVIVTDTAGIRLTAGKVEAIGVAKARERAVEADLVLWLEDANAPQVIDIGEVRGSVLRVGNKADLPLKSVDGYAFLVSAATGYGVDVLLAAIGDIAGEKVGFGSLLPIHQRQIGLLRDTLVELELAGNKSLGLDLVAEHLRRASDHIGRLTGRVDVDELLDVIFSKFCIGK